MGIYDLLEQAILNKQQVIAIYKGYYREMCPHILGTKMGKAYCLFYQFGGQSSSGTIIPESEENWRCIPVDGLENVSLREGDWHSGHRHTKRQTCVDEIDIDVNLLP